MYRFAPSSNSNFESVLKNGIFFWRKSAQMKNIHVTQNLVIRIVNRMGFRDNNNNFSHR